MKVKPDPSKVEAVQKMAPPQDKAALERLRGTVSYLYKFVPILYGGMCPIYDLARPISEWMWDAVCQKAFAEMKRFLTQAPVLAYFDPSKSAMIQCDAGGQWLGATIV